MTQYGAFELSGYVFFVYLEADENLICTRTSSIRNILLDFEIFENFEIFWKFRVFFKNFDIYLSH